MAAVTRRIRFFSNVLKLAIREPVLVAKTVGSAACLSGERVDLGVGLSWMPEEFHALHQDTRTLEIRGAGGAVAEICDVRETTLRKRRNGRPRKHASRRTMG